MKHALLDSNGLVVNIVECDAGYQSPEGLTLVQSDDAEIGGSFLEGRYLALPRATISLADAQAAAQSRIDSYFETLYSASVANGAIGAEYDAAYIVAKEWLKDTTKPAPERIKALAESYGITNVQAAGVVVSKWTEAQAVAFDLRGAARLRAKLAIRQAADADGVAAAEMAGRAAMEAVVYSV